ncbi:hypothetical protein M404DRAFT_872085 [Pisolithus tinctorius Marx 270]|uniref:Uncharacterized protein n=1 Tax=Pisolithus tinctorius Marx 270 TaxID=870435 RepID=A0A0C3PP68_PISTI|nr:hypothetical protein M404DRAFT_872085 [Pisolithus tinctorius Marx 270]
MMEMRDPCARHWSQNVYVLTYRVYFKRHPAVWLRHDRRGSKYNHSAKEISPRTAFRSERPADRTEVPETTTSIIVTFTHAHPLL